MQPKSSSSPKVSIILATYNREKFLREAVISVLEQTYQDFELIIIDDGSTDNTRSLITEFSDPRIQYKYQVNKGRSNARNVGLQIARGHYITFLDSDDLYLPQKLALQIEFLDNNLQVGMVYTSAYCINESGNILSHKYKATCSGSIYKKIAFFVPVTITLPTVMTRREIFLKTGFFDENMSRFEDTDMWRRISKITHVSAMSEYTCKLRTHSENHILSQNPQQIVDAIHYYAKKIMQEDRNMSIIALKRGLGGLYHHYGHTMMYIPGWKSFAVELLESAYNYWPLYRYPKISYKAIFNYIKKKFTKIENNIEIAQAYIPKGNKLDKTKDFLPKVSIIIPVYNGENYLREAINSALDQTYPNIEIIVINDGSRDDGATERIALSFGDKIRYFNKPNGGVASALNLGISHMTGDYFSWLSHDDLYVSEKIGYQIKALSEIDSDRVVLYSNYSIFTTDPDKDTACYMKGVSPEKFRYWITFENCLHGCTLLIPKAAFAECGLFNENLLTTQDYDLWFRIAEKYQFIHLPAHLVKSRSHQEQGSITMKETALKECNTLLSKFAKQLNAIEIQQAAHCSTGLSYAQLASSMWYRGFFSAGRTSAVLSLKHCLNAPLKEVILLQCILAKGVLLHYFAKPTRKILPPRLRIIVRNSLKSITDTVKSALIHTSITGTNQNVQPSSIDLLVNKSLSEKFSTVYEKNLFGGRISRSGEGSDLAQTAVIRKEIPNLLKELKISSMLDAPCGDWFWMKHVNLDIEHYIGVDIVKEMINSHQKKYANDHTHFKCINLVEEKLPKVDLIFSRDCFVHLSNKDVLNIIENFKASGATYLLTTTFVARTQNEDLGEGFWRALNMQLAPFNFPTPLKLINEECTEENNMYTDKSLGLWRLADLLE
ncbi:MAG: hypothetical protein BGO43_06515 [Gammaproteobacteria bacterium 39-13]|nr:MAG: hypothetical protein BGO43_06515 [Gammaproteobacteria bacterium 39-13]